MGPEGRRSHFRSSRRDNRTRIFWLSDSLYKATFFYISCATISTCIPAKEKQYLRASDKHMTRKLGTYIGRARGPIIGTTSLKVASTAASQAYMVEWSSNQQIFSSVVCARARSTGCIAEIAKEICHHLCICFSTSNCSLAMLCMPNNICVAKCHIYYVYLFIFHNILDIHLVLIRCYQQFRHGICMPES